LDVNHVLFECADQCIAFVPTCNAFTNYVNKE